MNFVIGLFFSLAAADLGCPAYHCGDSTAECAIGDVNSTSYTVSPCSNFTEDCPVPKPYESSACVPISAEVPCSMCKFPNESCKSDSECYTGQCTDSVCQGKSLGDECVTSGDCNPGLSCFNYACGPVIEVNQTGCSQEFDCVNSATCDLRSRTCVPYYSAPPRKFVGDCDCDSNISKTCASSFCVCLQGPNISSGVCLTSPVSPQLPRACSVNSDCGGVASDGRIYNSDCTCGFNGQGQRYCELFPADKPFLSYLDLLREFYASPMLNSTCNVNARLSQDCLEKVKGADWVNQFNRANLLVKQYPLIQSNPDCIKQTFTSEFWGTHNQTSLYTSNVERLMTH